MTDALLTPRQTWVHLLVWCPADTSNPREEDQLWPRVLQVARGDEAGPPGVVLRPGEPVRHAAERVAGALGLTLPPLRLLAVDQQPAEGDDLEQLGLVLDGGRLAANALRSCDCDSAHELVWTPVGELGRVALVHALRTLLLDERPAVLWQGLPAARGSGPGAGTW
ncbi:hypothetical protein OYE22_10515 [Streptomyces sp. 71268]|uniref:hypothetical protein n=1 Tax=Streptomyces sp. 71268 TaxID=3002640 RepID=UPI0023FA164B|nr:hypothetical protein [Streptomyces sp. 71268]WEV25573.1 hypothetical protein OYE22_10515 [Streptomyces sp. 71268]